MYKIPVKQKKKLLIALNSIPLYPYFSHRDHFRRKPPSENNHYSAGNAENRQSFRAKPWPIWPSYFLWSLNPKVPLRSCKAYFGNGFTRRIDILKYSPGAPMKPGVSRGGGWFRCSYSRTLRSSICEGGRIRKHPEKKKMSIGGEKLETMIGRGEDEELPLFGSGAFDVEVVDGSSRGGRLLVADSLDKYLPPGVISKHTMRSLVESIQLVGAKDFHCSEAPLEETWRALFSSLTYAKNFSGCLFSPRYPLTFGL